MIGLNTSIFKSAGRKLVNLLGALKDRAAYYENGTDSTAEKNRIDDLGVLDKATILLTPTATSDARVHSVKTYTGDELVTNGDFSDGSNGWFVTNGNVTDKYNASMTAYQSGIKITPFNKTGTYRVTFDLVVTSGSCKFDAGGGNDEIFSTSGSKTIYVTNTLKFEFNAFNLGWVGSLDNVSVVDVSSDFDFDRASSATRINSSGLVQDMQSITDPELVLNGDFEELGDELITNGSLDTNSGWTFVNGPTYNSNGYIDFNLVGGNARTDINVVQGKVYKVVYEIKNYQEGTIKFRFQGGTNTGGQQQSGNGIKTEYVTCNDSSNNNFQFFGSSSFIGSVDNVSVQQVDPNDRWTLGTGWSIEDGVAVASNSSANATQETFTIDASKTYKIDFTISDYDSGTFFITFGGNDNSSNFTANGSYTVYITPTNRVNNIFYLRGSNFTGKIDNISVKDVTFSTDVDLARINYDSNGENGHILLEPTSTNLFRYSEDIDSNGVSKVGSSLDSNVTTSPDGTLNADLLKENNQSGSHFIYKDLSVSSGQDYTISLFAKSNGVNRDLRFGDGGLGWSSGFTANFDLSEGTATGGGVIENYGNGWYRCSVTGTTNATTARLIIYCTLNGTTSYSGDGESGLFLWGMQLEALSYVTSYIPNYGAAVGVTRATETLLDSGNTTLINTDQGVFYAEIARTSNNANHELICLLQGASYTNTKIAIGFYSNNNNFFIRTYYDSSDVYPIYDAITPNLNQFYKVAIKYNRNGINNVWIDGVKVVADVVENVSAPSNPLTQLRFDWNPASTQFPFHGKCKAVAVFNEALEDDELELLTGVTNYGSFSELASANGYTII